MNGSMLEAPSEPSLVGFAGRILNMVPIAEKEATWDLFVVWQRGKTAGPLRALLDALRSGHGS
jgi:hypothetical protein